MTPTDLLAGFDNLLLELSDNLVGDLPAHTAGVISDAHRDKFIWAKPRFWTLTQPNFGI
ncbi:MAG: hypothetical protein KDA60_21105 [Planctomycetales bacterium]|nr:hypothetical protein [Planctomycetales bacterium]